MKRLTLTNALKVLFAVYAVYAAIVSTYSLVRYSQALSRPWAAAPMSWFWAGFALCLLPVAWGLMREKKWAWNAAAGLMIFGLVVGTLSTVGTFWALRQSMTGSDGLSTALARSFVFGSARTLALLTLLILARRSYQTEFGAVPTGGELKRNSYLRPMALGVLFLMIGSLMLLHPASGKYSPTGWRVVALALAVILAAGAPLCFSERKAKLARRLAIFAIVTAVVGLGSSVAMYAYFAIQGLCVGGVQLLASIAAVVIAAKAPRCFVD